MNIGLTAKENIRGSLPSEGLRRKGIVVFIDEILDLAHQERKVLVGLKVIDCVVNFAMDSLMSTAELTVIIGAIEKIDSESF
jgi:sensor histidine kinase YesM